MGKGDLLHRNKFRGLGKVHLILSQTYNDVKFSTRKIDGASFLVER